jgi:hypothetical protein
MDQFWQQDIINEWNDEYSPRKTPKPQRSSSEDTLSPKKSPIKQDRLTKGAKKAFSEHKHTLASSFLAELDETITDLPTLRLNRRRQDNLEQKTTHNRRARKLETGDAKILSLQLFYNLSPPCRHRTSRESNRRRGPPS